MMNRRDFLALATAANSATAGQKPLEQLNVKTPLEHRIRLIQTFVHQQHYSEEGLLYSHINFAEERPHRAGELS